MGLNYVTYKYVLLKDARLGLLYYILVLLAVVYTVMEIFVSKGYLRVDTHPQGTVKLILSDSFAEGLCARHDNQSGSSGALPYCSGKTSCRQLDPWNLNWPVESRAVTIATFVKDRIQVLRNSSEGVSNEYDITHERAYFTETPECVVVKVDHAVVATLFTDARGREKLAASHRQLKGFLADVNGDVVRELSLQHGKPDKVSLHELLGAAGVASLDTPSDSISADGRAFRERGLILRVTIFYQNWFSTWFGTSDIYYTYHVRRVPFIDHDSKQVQSLLSREEVLEDSSAQPKWRLQRKRYAIRVEFEQAGSLGMFSIPMLLLKLVSGMGLLTLTATVIDTLALYVLPARESYRRYVYEESEELKRLPLMKRRTDEDKLKQT